LLPDFELAMTKNENLYIPRNTHWNNDGNTFAADIIFENILELGLIKKSDN